MATESIADIYDALKHANGEYCSICFRPASERKLVTPVFLIQLPRFYRKDAVEKRAVKVCYMCEAMAARVVRFQQAVNLAATVEVMLTWMTDELRDALKHPSKFTPQDTLQTVNRVKEIETRMRKAKIPQITCSTVLLVGSDTIAKPGGGTTPNCTSQHGTRPADVNFVGPRRSTASFVGASPNGTNPLSTIYLDIRPVSTRFVGATPNGTRPITTSVCNASANGTRPIGTKVVGASPNGTRRESNNHPILIEDASPPRTADNKRDRGMVQVTSVPDRLQLQVVEQATGNTILHPIIIGTDGKMYVPSLKVQVVNNEELKSVSDEVLFKYANIPIPPKEPMTQKKPMTPTKPENTRMIDNYYEFIKQQSKDKVEIENNKELESAVDSIANKKARLDIEGPKPDSNGRSGGIRHGAGGASKLLTCAVKNARKPVLRMDKVMDWEDKIPMDVISFMDASDPNPIERIMQPNLSPSPSLTMGVISDVRTIDDDEDTYISSDNDNPIYVKINSNNDSIVNTVKFVNNVNSDEDIDNDVQVVENIECIDLC